MAENRYTGYVDHEYLRKLAAMLAPVKQLSYELMCISPKDSVLDIGCGPGVDTIALGKMYAHGRVCGVDRDTAMLKTAASGSPPPNVFHVAAAADALPFVDGTFDACRSERLLQHLSCPAVAVREALRVVRPGGKIVLVDTDHSTLSIDTNHDAIEWKFRTYYHQRLANGTSGRRLFRLLKEAGATNVQVRSVPFILHSFSALRMVIEFDMVLAEAVHKGVLSAQEGARFTADCLEQERAGSFSAFPAIIIADGVR